MEDDNEIMEKTMGIAKEIAKKSVMSTRMIKEAIHMSQDVGITQGIKSERQMFRSLFSTSFKQKGTEEFLNKKK